MNAPIDAIRAVVGPKGLLTAEPDLEPYLVEERGRYRGTCDAVVRPATTDEVSRVLALCAEAGTPVYPLGGNTGLVGGGVPEGGIVLSTERLTRVRAVDPGNHTITVEAGVILADVQRAAAEAGAFFPLSLAAEGSCRIGGNLATNAGGVNVLRYGNARDLTLGLEVVLADGRVWDGLRGLRKDNTGYDLKDLFIGSEGTLGVITAATLALFPAPRVRETALCALPSAAAVMDLFERLRDGCGDALTAFEMMARRGLDFACRYLADCTDPFDAPHAWYALVEVTSPRTADDLRAALEAVLGAALEEGLVDDAVLAESGAQADALWRLREGIPEAQKHAGASIKHDVAVPISRIPDFLDAATRAVEAALPGVRVCPFGHAGDGNIHFNLSQPEETDRDAFLARWPEMNRLVHDIAVEMGGTFSAEHGIGQMKTADLAHYRSAVELDLMREVKQALDPAGILNPGRVVPPGP